MNEVQQSFAAALARRASLLERARQEGTDCVRLFHGVAEGAAGLTIDRYGPVLLVQTQASRPVADADDVARLADQARRALDAGLALAWNVRGGAAVEQPPFEHGGPFVGHELGLSYDVRPRHRGQDPLLFLDFRAARRLVRARAAGASVLNVFAYTCGIGVAALAGGAREVWNVDFARSALEVGRHNAALNGLSPEAFRTIEADAIPTMRQLAGLGVKGRGARRGFTRFTARTFDLVVLDPPRWAKTPFGAVDVVNDYPSLLKPAIGCARPGGLVIATHHVPTVTRAQFEAIVRRTAEKMGRPFAELSIVGPEEDFPSFDGEPPLKIAVGVVS
ncbi:MAG: class I SAM-dependent methyltransferase [Sandaracinaceae bacterium]|nr:class I SAM-dependent methyltransferase [Sandaracinaceae bacterium]